MNKNANQVIEILDEIPVAQINTIPHFKSRSKYWGSKYGVADRSIMGYRVLAEANHQRWLCPKYTSDTTYHIGSENPVTGQILECGTWRCDTYVWWAFYSQGLDTMPGRVWLPRKLFNHFPYASDESSPLEIPSESLTMTTHNALENITTEALNAMPHEAFQAIMDAPPSHYVTSPSTVQLQFAYDPTLHDIKRGIMIDRLIAEDVETDLVKKLLHLYDETDQSEVKHKIVQGLMLYNQRHKNIASYTHHEHPLLKAFFAELLNAKSLHSKMADDVIRGYIETHAPEEIMVNRGNIDKWLSNVDHYSSIMLKYTLVHQSKALQQIYIKSIVDELREANSADLDSYLFGPLSIGYQHSGENLLEPTVRQMIIDYLKEVRPKYTSQDIKVHLTNPHRSITAPYYFKLIKQLGIQ